MAPKLPPHDLSAEQAALGAMLLSKDAISDSAEILKPHYFYRPIHSDVFEAIIDLVNAGEPADPVTVARELEKRGLLKRIGGAPYLHTLLETVPTASSGAYYARIVYDRWRQRRLIEVGQRISQLGFIEATSSDDVDDLLAQVDTEFRELGGGATQHTGLNWDDLVKKWLAWQDTKGTAIPTPWPELNTKLPGGGVSSGQLIVVGGRPGAGKSNAGLNMVLHAAERQHKTTVFSVEMDDVEVCSRLLAAGTWGKVGQIFAKNMDKETTERVEEYILEKRGLPLQVVDRAYITVEQIIAHCRIRHPKVIFVDYTQLIHPTNNKLVREQQVAHITRSLKVAAKQLQMVVIVASQLRRSDRDGPPTISDLRESGAAEQDADIVLLLHRLNHDTVTMIIGKNRNGPVGSVSLRFRGENARVGS